MGKQGLNDIEFVDIRRGYEHEQGLTARMMAYPDAKVALAASRVGETPIYDDIVRPTPDGVSRATGTRR